MSQFRDPLGIRSRQGLKIGRAALLFFRRQRGGLADQLRMVRRIVVCCRAHSVL